MEAECQNPASWLLENEVRSLRIAPDQPNGLPPRPRVPEAVEILKLAPTALLLSGRFVAHSANAASPASRRYRDHQDDVGCLTPPKGQLLD